MSMLKIRRPLGRLIFNMGNAIPGKTVFLIETASCTFLSCAVSGAKMTIYKTLIPSVFKWIASESNCNSTFMQWISMFRYALYDLSVCFYPSNTNFMELWVTTCFMKYSSHLNCLLLFVSIRTHCIPLQMSDAFSSNMDGASHVDIH